MALVWKCVVSNDANTGAFRDNPNYPAADYYYNNANVIWATLTQYGWTLEAICGAMGVFDWESGGFNPGIGELGGWPLPTGSQGNWDTHSHPSGLGLIQWTAPNGYYPVYSTVDPNPLLELANAYNQNWYDGPFQLLALNHCDDPAYKDFYAPSVGAVTALWGWRVNDSTFTTWGAYKSGTLSPEDMARVFLANVEGVPGDNLAWRQNKARFWYNTFYGQTPDPDVPIMPDVYPGNVQGFVNWCYDKCQDPDVQYSRPNREEQTINGITYYDCSSFIWYGLLHNDFDVTATNHPNRAFTTSEMPADLALMGFTEIDRSGEIKPGDIGWNPDHAEVCYSGGSGQGVFMGAHSDQLPAADQVSVNNFASAGTDFEKIFRFAGGSPGPAPGPGTKGKKLLWMYIRNWPYRIY